MFLILRRAWIMRRRDRVLARIFPSRPMVVGSPPPKFFNCAFAAFSASAWVLCKLVTLSAPLRLFAQLPLPSRYTVLPPLAMRHLLFWWSVRLGMILTIFPWRDWIRVRPKTYLQILSLQLVFPPTLPFRQSVRIPRQPRSQHFLVD